MKYIALSLFLIVLASCHEPIPETVFEVTAYNAYAFFDDYEDGDEYEGFTRRDGYDGEAYITRVKETAILLGREFSSSDVIVLSEIESSTVLEDLLEAGLKEKGFRYYGIAENDNGPLFVGFISRCEPIFLAVHNTPGCRPMLEAVFLSGEERVRLYGLHFRSRFSGGEDERRSQAEHLAFLMERNAGISIALGDFNTDPSVHGTPFSIYPVDYNPDNPFHVTGDPSRAGERIYYSPFLDSDVIVGEKGTYFYEGRWYCFDNILLSSACWDGSGLEFEKAEVRTVMNMKDNGGRPMPYDVSTGFGYSDHFPVTVRLRKY